MEDAFIVALQRQETKKHCDGMRTFESHDFPKEYTLL